MNVVSLGSVLTIGYLEDMHKYADLAQEAIQTILDDDNAALVQGVLLPMFVGSAHEGTIALV